MLADHSDATITALDNDENSLNTLLQRAREKGISKRVTSCCASMFSIPFPDQSFDLIWSEGSAYIMGFEKAISEWRRLLTPEGYLVISDLVWMTENPEPDISAFWSKEYPDMQGSVVRLNQAREAGYELLDHFTFDHVAWENYTHPLRDRIDQLSPLMPDCEAISQLKTELKILARFEGQFSYQMMVLKKLEVKK